MLELVDELDELEVVELEVDELELVELEVVELEELLEELLELVVDVVELEVVVLEETTLLEDVEAAELSELLGASDDVVPLLHAVSVSKTDINKIALKIFFFIFCPFRVVFGTYIPYSIIYIVKRFLGDFVKIFSKKHEIPNYENS